MSTSDTTRVRRGEQAKAEDYLRRGGYKAPEVEQRARGGRVGKHHGPVNVIVAPGAGDNEKRAAMQQGMQQGMQIGAHMGAAAAARGGPPGGPGGGPPGPPPGAMPPGGGPGGPGGPPSGAPPMMAGRPMPGGPPGAPPVPQVPMGGQRPFYRGGRVNLDAGAGGGKGRLEKADMGDKVKVKAHFRSRGGRVK